MQEKMPERMSNRMSGDIPDRMPESPSEYILIIFLMPDDMSNYVRMICQGGNNTK